MESASKSSLEMKKLNKINKDDDFCDKNHCDPEIINYLEFVKEILKNHYNDKLSR